jgi:rSAM/selenodomain-associated transferase 2
MVARAKISGVTRELLTPKDDIDNAATYGSYLQRVAAESSGERIGVVITAFNNAATIAGAIDAARQAFLFSPLVVVDGGSTDRTAEIASSAGAQVLSASRSRGRQRRIGASAALNADWLLFLHGDCVLPSDAQALVAGFIEQPRAQVATFRLRFDSPNVWLRSCAWFTRFSTPCTRFGNQGILIRRAFYEALGGFPEWPLFEDVELLRRARAVAPIHVLPGFVTASAQRFHERGIIRTLGLNARLLARLAAGTPPSELAERYFAPAVQKTARTAIANEARQPLPASPPAVVPAKLA